MSNNWSVMMNRLGWHTAASFETLLESYMFIVEFSEGDMKVVSYRRCD